MAAPPLPPQSPQIFHAARPLQEEKVQQRLSYALQPYCCKLDMILTDRLPARSNIYAWRATLFCNGFFMPTRPSHVVRNDPVDLSRREMKLAYPDTTRWSSTRPPVFRLESGRRKASPLVCRSATQDLELQLSKYDKTMLQRTNEGLR
eukprot:1158872-Pelagomonas_calceolata.AAC.5